MSRLKRDTRVVPEDATIPAASPDGARSVTHQDGGLAGQAAATPVLEQVRCAYVGNVFRPGAYVCGFCAMLVEHMPRARTQNTDPSTMAPGSASGSTTAEKVHADGSANPNICCTRSLCG